MHLKSSSIWGLFLPYSNHHDSRMPLRREVVIKLTQIISKNHIVYIHNMYIYIHTIHFFTINYHHILMFKFHHLTLGSKNILRATSEGGTLREGAQGIHDVLRPLPGPPVTPLQRRYNRYVPTNIGIISWYMGMGQNPGTVPWTPSHSWDLWMFIPL